MDWTTGLALGLFGVAWLLLFSQSRDEDWSAGRTLGMVVFLAGATCGVFLDNLLSAGSPLLPWVEPVAAVVMLLGLFVAWIRERSDGSS